KPVKTVFTDLEQSMNNVASISGPRVSRYGKGKSYQLIGDLIDPVQITRQAGGDRDSDNLGKFVGMQRQDGFFHAREILLVGLDQQLVLFLVVHLVAPFEIGMHAGKYIHAGSQ